jgi:putative ABC transport system permease protein
MGDDHVAMVFVSVSDEARIARVQKRLQDALHVRRRVQAGLEDDFTVSDMREVAATLSTVTSVLTAFLGAVGAVSLLVGGIGIMNIMLVSVTERTREIGVRLAIGARPADIRLQFLVESVVLSVLGGTLGVVVGLLGAFGATKALDLTFTPNFTVVGGSFIFCAVVGVAFGWLPAQRASALDPIVALRHE